MFIAVFSDVGDICMISRILRKHKYHQILQRHALSSGKRLYVEMAYKHFSGLCKLYLKKM